MKAWEGGAIHPEFVRDLLNRTEMPAWKADVFLAFVREAQALALENKALRASRDAWRHEFMQARARLSPHEDIPIDQGRTFERRGRYIPHDDNEVNHD